LASALVDRRQFLLAGTVAGAAAALQGQPAWANQEKQPLYQISLAQWSLHRSLNRDGSDHLRFPQIAKQECGIDAIELVNQFFKDKANDQKYLADLKHRCDDQGVKCLLIMCDGEGNLGDPDKQQRAQAVRNHFKWVEAAKFLGCHSIRVNAASEGSFDDQMRLAADGLAQLGEFAGEHGLNVLVENHGGLSSNGAWLAGVMKQVGAKNVGTLPDFGNFRVGPDQEYDRYQGVEELMPFAKAVSAKSHEFDSRGNETKTDYLKMMRIVLRAGYRGYVGIEWEGEKPDELAGIQLTKKLLQRVRDELASEFS
jgi:sugar phosphate isomerase/epimerase